MNLDPLQQSAEAAFEGIRGRLLEFLADSGARLGLVLDRGGAVVLEAGDTEGLDIAIVGSLAAAHFAANEHLATLVGEPEFRTLLHQGRRVSIFLGDMKDTALLALVYERQVRSDHISVEGLAIINELQEPLLKLISPSSDDQARAVGTEWVSAVQDELDRVFGDWE